MGSIASVQRTNCWRALIPRATIFPNRVPSTPSVYCTPTPKRPARALISRGRAALVRDACLTYSLGQLGSVPAANLAEDHAHAAGRALQVDEAPHALEAPPSA